MKNYEVLEDNGGGVYLVIFDDEDKEKVEYLHAGYELGPSGRLYDDLEALRSGDDQRTGTEMQKARRSYTSN